MNEELDTLLHLRRESDGYSQSEGSFPSLFCRDRSDPASSDISRTAARRVLVERLPDELRFGNGLHLIFRLK
jgi:hypothetical protein